MTPLNPINVGAAMSENIFDRANLYVTRFVGPSGLEGDTRRRYQFTVGGTEGKGGYTVLTRQDIDSLRIVLERELSRD